MKSLTDYLDYRDFLKSYIDALPKNGRGFKKELAEFLLCQNTHISQVLGKRSNFTLEQGIRVAEFIHLNFNDKNFFMILLNLARAGSKSLREYYDFERLEFIQNQKSLKEKLKKKFILDQNQLNKYYSNWYYPAIHVLLSVPQFQNPQFLINYLPLNENKILEALTFLTETGLAIRSGNKYIISKVLMEKPTKNSDSYKNFLKNWRNQSILSIDGENKDDYHNTIIFSISLKDAQVIEKMIQQFYEKVDKIIPNSKEETVKALSMDFFTL